MDQPESVKLFSISQVDVSLTNLHLPDPSERDTGGYFSLSPSGKRVWVYSPIDLLVAGIQSVISNIKITNLGQWFKNNPTREADNYVTLLLLEDDKLTYLSISQLKYIKKYQRVLKRNAPFTFY